MSTSDNDVIPTSRTDVVITSKNTVHMKFGSTSFVDVVLTSDNDAVLTSAYIGQINVACLFLQTMVCRSVAGRDLAVYNMTSHLTLTKTKILA